MSPNVLLHKPHFKILAESHNLFVGNVFETAYLIDKRTNKEIVLGSFYGNPTCALIGINEKWCLVGGEILILWKQEEIGKIEVFNIFDMREVENSKVEILTDPWAEESAVWKLNVETGELNFVREFRKYRNKEYTEDVDW